MLRTDNHFAINIFCFFFVPDTSYFFADKAELFLPSLIQKQCVKIHNVQFQALITAFLINSLLIIVKRKLFTYSMFLPYNLGGSVCFQGGQVMFKLHVHNSSDH